MACSVESLQGKSMRKLFIAVLMMFCTCLLFGQTDRSLVREGNSLYKQDKYADAETNYRKALEKNKEFNQGVFNLGDALYKQGRYDEAAEQYRNSAAKETDPSAKAQALHNLGNSLLKGKKIPESISAYEEALKLHPDDLDTKYNLEYAQALLQQQQQKQNQKNNDKKDNKDQQKQDQQKKDQQKQDQQKQDQQKQDQQKQDSQQKNQDQKQQQDQAQQRKQQISKKDAERILEALNNQEKDVQKKLKKKVPARVHVDKDW